MSINSLNVIGTSHPVLTLIDSTLYLSKFCAKMFIPVAFRFLLHSNRFKVVFGMPTANFKTINVKNTFLEGSTNVAKTNSSLGKLKT